MTDRHQFSGSAQATTLAMGLAAGDISISAVNAAGFPSGLNPFVVVIGRGTSKEERVLCASTTGNVILVAAGGRAYDGTNAQTHAAGESLQLALAAVEMDQVNRHGADTTLDEHTQYLTPGRHDLTARHVFGAAFPSPAAASASAPGDVAAAGAAAGPADAAHVHGREATGPAGFHDSRIHYFGTTQLLDMQQGRLYFAPFRVYSPVTISQFQSNWTIAGSSNMTVTGAIFAGGANIPTTQVSTSVVIPGNVTGIQTFTVGATALGVGVYWACMMPYKFGQLAPRVTATGQPPALESYLCTPQTLNLGGPGLAADSANGFSFNPANLFGNVVPLIFGIS